MFAIVVFVVLTVLVGLAVVFGWSADTRQPGRRWYPAGPDRPENYRTN
jgi:hypothetical protein